MTVQEIQSKVNEGASARFPEVIGRVFSTLVARHTHNSWRKDCHCDYCRFIVGDYVNAKLALHAIKKRINYLEWVCTDTEIHTMHRLYEQQLAQKVFIYGLKQRKQDLKQNVL